MCIPRQHMDCLDFFTADLEVKHFVSAQFSHLDETVARHNDKKLPLGMVPMLALGDAGLGDVHTHLPALVAA